jgi:hypothetical protein
MNDFDPAALEAAQSYEITVSMSREMAVLVAECLEKGLEAAPDAIAPQDEIDDAFDLAERLSNYGRTGIDHPDCCFCIRCGQPDEPALHDPERCS